MKKLMNLLKTNRIAYCIYSGVFNFILSILKLFVKVDDKIILFNSYGGKKYNDSPRVIYEYMLSQKKYEKYKFYWSLDNPNEYSIPHAIIVKNNSIKFFLIALKAKYWITNSGIERGLKFKNKNTFYINTWHGTPVKFIGSDENNLRIKFKTSKPDVVYAQGEYDASIYSRIFDIPSEKVKIVGFPRNDELFDIQEDEIKKIKENLNIPSDKKVILYAPTFREYNSDSQGCIFAPPINISKWKKSLSKNYVVLFRAHYEVNKVLGIKSDDFIYNVSNYNEINDLLKISDILISDYSSLFFDYSILKRPMYCYAYDYDEYSEKRGLYIDLNKELPNGICKTEEELLSRIQSCDFEKEKYKSEQFLKKYLKLTGNARKYVDEIIS